MRVKICGITTCQDADEAVAAGADLLGLNFVGGPRQLTLELAKPILESLPPLVSVVALIRMEAGTAPEDLLSVLASHRISHLQLYGQFTVDDLVQLRRRNFHTLPVLQVRNAAFYQKADNWLTKASKPSAIVLDAYDPQCEGGTGKVFCWDWVTQARENDHLKDWPPILLAGGLNSTNVADAIRTVHPYGVDVSSGVEKANQPGRKDPLIMRQFVRNARQAALAL